VRIARFIGTVAFVVLAARQLAYLLAPQPAITSLPDAVGGPGLVVTTLVVIPLALALGCALLWLAALGVRERHLLSEDAIVAPRVRPAAVALDGAAIAVAGCAAFAALESWVHWRAGLGFHGLACLMGHQHRNAIPIIFAVALLTAAARGALRHVVAWMRRTIVLLRARPRALPHAILVHSATAEPALSSLLGNRIRVRGPPPAAVPG
jgi:hypothetical protein